MAMKAGPTSCALGPNAVDTLDAGHLCTTPTSSENENGRTFSSATIYFPETGTNLPSIVIVGGWGCGERTMAAWAPFLASHGIVAMTIGMPKPWEDTPPVRAKALLDASKALQGEDTRSTSPLSSRLNANARAVMGYSLGGGGAQLAALSDPTLKSIIAILPHDGREYGVPFPEELSAVVPVLILAGEKDNLADPQIQAWEQYRKTTAPKMILEIKGGDHYSALGPSGGNQADADAGDEPCVLCNCIFATLCGCGPCPMGDSNGPTGHARNEAPRGAVGGIVLAWLQLFLLEDESARSRLEAKPDIASGFESQQMDRR